MKNARRDVRAGDCRNRREFWYCRPPPDISAEIETKAIPEVWLLLKSAHTDVCL